LVPLSLGGCGGAKDDVPSEVRLAGTPFPTVTPEPTIAPVCSPPVELAMPPDFPADVTIPDPGKFKVWEVSTDPHLRVVLRAERPGVPSVDLYRDAERGLLDRMLPNFTLRHDPNVNGVAYNFTAEDGRAGHVQLLPVAECDGQVLYIYDIYWITPDASN
jgi:hypothetical protein